MLDGYRVRLVDPLLDELLLSLPAVLLVGPRGCGKSTTAARRADSIVRLDVPAEAAAFRTDPDAFLRGLAEPVLIDEWQLVPESFAAVKRAVDAHPRPGRFLLTGSSYGDIEGATAAGTGRIVRVSLLGMCEREITGDAAVTSLIDRLAAGEPLGQPSSAMDLRDYVDLAVRSGFPEAISIGSGLAHELWLEGYATQITTRDVTGTVGPRDPERLRRFLEAYALNSAGIAEAKTIYEAAGVNKNTASAYERILENVFVTHSLPAWSTNRLKRLSLSSKRYLSDPGLLAAILRLDAAAILGDASLLGRVIETFVVAQLRAEAVVARSRPRLFHLRQRDGGHEVDVVLELGGGSVIAIEIKAGASVGPGDARHLAWLRDKLGEQFLIGLVLHTGTRTFPLGERISALPISGMW